MQATLKEKLGVESEPYVILGACNPPLAHRALEAEPDLGVLLPCNVVVYERDGETHVSAVDAERMLSIVGNDALTPVAADVRGGSRRWSSERSPTVHDALLALPFGLAIGLLLGLVGGGGSILALSPSSSTSSANPSSAQQPSRS